jgi:hypothetical protein|tara:strand:- start:3457 stop:3969 length:513 start_codon:yes stop_codon:yes gene_type:complete
MAGQISRPNNREFDIRDDETFSDWKRRKAEENGTVQGIGQKNKKDTSNWSEAQKRGKRSRDKGMRKQREARKQLKIPNSKFRSNMGNEENWRGELRFEVKAGKQIQTIWTKFLKMKEQSDSNLADVGTESKPFVAVIKPDGSTDGLVMFRISDVENVIWGFKENWQNYDD